MTIFHVLVWALFGLVIGAIARLLYPGKEGMGCSGSIVVGVAGSFVGGMINYLLGNSSQLFAASGFIMSLIGAIICLILWQSRSSILASLSSIWSKIYDRK